jgi:hypothetical protein
MYQFEFEIFKYSCNLYLSNGVSWLKLADTKYSLPHLEQKIFGIDYIMTADTKDGSLLSVDSNRHKKWVIFCITQSVSDLLAGTKDWLPVNTKNCFYSSASSRMSSFSKGERCHSRTDLLVQE